MLDAEAEISQAKNELGIERNWCIWVKKDLKMVVEDIRKRTTKDILEGECLETEAEREGERQ